MKEPNLSDNKLILSESFRLIIKFQLDT